MISDALDVVEEEMLHATLASSLMAKVERFEDLNCWRAARELVRLCYEASESGKLSRDYELRNQLRRAALSAMNNIAEGFGRGSSKEFIRFLDISQSSSMEVKSMTYTIGDTGSLNLEMTNRIRHQAESTKSLTLGLIRYLRRKL